MLHRASIMAAILVASLVTTLGSTSPAAADAEMLASGGSAAATSAEPKAQATDSIPAHPVLAAREAHQAAWAQRQAGDQSGAIATAQTGLIGVEEALARDPEIGLRLQLLEQKHKLAGLCELARKDITKASMPRDVADASVLNAPAVEDIEPQMNADVNRYVEYFSGNGRSVFERWLKRSGRYMSLFRDLLRREGLPPDLVHLVFVESGFNVHARSVSAAVGPWQFLRSTGRLFGLTVNQWVDERKDPEKSTVAAARYLKHLYAIFGDWPLALASYNAGEGAVLRAIKRQGTTNYWDLDLPRQTEDYVPQFMAVLTISRDPEKYGFDRVELEEPMRFDEVALKGAVDLRSIAKLAECSLEDMRHLNPAVLRHAAPGKDGVTMIRVPKGKAELILAKLEAGAAMPAVDLTVQHRVRRGETLQGIANQYHVSAQRLARENGISRKRPLQRGAVLKIRSDSKPAALSAAQLETDDPRRSTGYVPARPRRVPASLNADSEAGGRLTVTVRKGETLAMIAARHGVTVQDIRRWNRLKTSTVRRGTRLKIRTGDAAVASGEALAADSARVASIRAPIARKSSSANHLTVRVKAGDTLTAIAVRHGTTVEKLKRANGLTSGHIRTGQKLRIPA